MRMPEMSGLELLGIVKNKYPYIIRLILSGYADTQTLLGAINEGEIFRFITKPWKLDGELKTTVCQAIQYYDLRNERDKLIEELKEAHDRLEEKVEQRTRSLSIANEQLSSEIARRKITEEALVLSREQAEAANIAKGEFLANMSHELRTPMNAILGFTGLLADEELTEIQRSYVDLANDGGRNLLRLIDDILDFSEIDAGELDTEITECSLEDLLNSVESSMRPQAEKKGLAFQINRYEQLPSKIRTDFNRLRQCLLNLISNAVEFTEHGHVYVNVSLEDRNSEPFIRFDIEDTGIGIPPGKQEAIFRSFTQADGSSTRVHGGTGLGLTIAKRLAELLDGELSLTSTVDEGSVFSVIIPVGMETKTQSYLGKQDSLKNTIPASNE